MTKIALIGNPNTGKTSLFNELTGSYEYVGNWSGVTVEQKIGRIRNNKRIIIIDLPGVYSLSPISKDEEVVSTFFINQSFTGVLNIVDASQLERNLHLTIQLLEYGKPLIVALNMMDVAQRRGIHIDVYQLSKQLGVSVVPIVARTGDGCQELVEEVDGLKGHNRRNFTIDYGEVVERGIQKISELLDKNPTHCPYARWLAIQFFEGNPVVKSYIEQSVDLEELKEIMEEVAGKIDSPLSEYIYTVRSEKIEKIVSSTLSKTRNQAETLSEKIDRFVTNQYLGIPIFLLFMYLVFMITFNWVGFPLSDLLDAFFSGPLTDWLKMTLTAIGASQFLHNLILEGIVPGVSGVLVFVPQIFLLFFFISLLEDSGYMARAAVVMDRLMEKIGLNGKAFIPMIIGFGCNVPGIMGTRMIEQPKERLLTVLLTPLMSCSARLPIYALFAGTFFVKHQATVVFSLYVLGIVIAFLLAKIFSKTIVKNEPSLFVIELPPYRIPHFLTLWRSTWDKGKGFVKKAGTFIFAGSVVIWLLTVIGTKGFFVEMENSFLAMIGGVFAPIFAPLGFGTWQAGASLLTGFLAKESIVATMNIIYHVPDMDQLQGMVAQSFTPLSAYSFLVFVLLYLPCLATVATIKKETGSVKWTSFAVLYPLVIAYFVSFIVYQGGKILGLG
ncbi:ferrous iron transport protein B [Fervidibacillus halotolerans]|uniref:Ferrous iron transport protein B n=1 Tax=Fervidibacillus halotolerans TaxID=2980027 RepID=A0A9E8M051_9BACI|nr:ferrous iron transport protein B [Fervidibacillus halotolerans]WAA12756.1 ferrous iron transport protein B [Fervidibacillus halotolerans]